MKSLGVTPSPEWEKVLFSPARLLLAMGGEGSGKSYMGALFAVCHSVYDVQFGAKLYWIVGADFEDARMEFDYILEFMQRLGNVEEVTGGNNRDQQCTLLTKTGQRFVTISAYDFTKLGREEPDGIVGCEVSRWYEEAFSRCEGRLVRRFPHAWGFFSGSYETSRGWLPALAQLGRTPNARNLISYGIPSWANRWRYPLGEGDPAIQAARASRSPEKFMERFGGEPAPAHTVIFSEFRNVSHVDKSVDYVASLPVYLAIDPGDKVYCVLFVQPQDNGEIWVMDEVYVSKWTHQQVIQEVQLRDGWPLVKGGAIDIAAKQGHMGMPRPIEEWYKDTRLILWVQKHSVEDSIERLRLALSYNPRTGRSRLRVHPRCRGLISEMGGTAEPSMDIEPWSYYESRFGLGQPKAENNHACTALSYFLAGPYGLNQVEKSYEPVSYLTRRKHA